MAGSARPPHGDDRTTRKSDHKGRPYEPSTNHPDGKSSVFINMHYAQMLIEYLQLRYIEQKSKAYICPANYIFYVQKNSCCRG